ncbi:MAG: site-2 protease family protein [Verrucomicrobia bacterium]|nr:site-2 protease family protein [Verrucomicrobiota bacterium]
MEKRLSISISPMFWVFAGILGFLMSQSLLGTGIWIGVILISVVVHELGHALTANAFGQSAHIRLLFFGGATYREQKSIGLLKEFLITLNGPLFGFALGILMWGVQHFLWLHPPFLVAYTLTAFVFVNIFWSILNLLPVMPMDGGQLLRIVCEGIFKNKGTAIALMISLILALSIAVAGFFMGQIFLGAIFLLFAFESFRGWKVARHSSPADTKVSLRERFQVADAKMASGQFDEALREFEQIRIAAGHGLLYIASTELCAQIYANRGEIQKAYDYLKEIKRHISPETLPLFHRLAYRTGDIEEAIALGKECYQASPDYQVALINALAHAVKSEVTPALGWLKCAVRDGLPNVEEVVQGREFDPIRNDPKFSEFAHKEPAH